MQPIYDKFGNLIVISIWLFIKLPSEFFKQFTVFLECHQVVFTDNSLKRLAIGNKIFEVLKLFFRYYLYLLGVLFTNLCSLYTVINSKEVASMVSFFRFRSKSENDLLLKTILGVTFNPLTVKAEFIDAKFSFASWVFDFSRYWGTLPESGVDFFTGFHCSWSAILYHQGLGFVQGCLQYGGKVMSEIYVNTSYEAYNRPCPHALEHKTIISNKPFSIFWYWAKPVASITTFFRDWNYVVIAKTVCFARGLHLWERGWFKIC